MWFIFRILKGNPKRIYYGAYVHALEAFPPPRALRRGLHLKEASRLLVSLCQLAYLKYNININININIYIYVICIIYIYVSKYMYI